MATKAELEAENATLKAEIDTLKAEAKADKQALKDRIDELQNVKANLLDKIDKMKAYRDKHSDYQPQKVNRTGVRVGK